MLLVVGAGISGATIARCLADAGRSVLVVEAADHVGGHCHTERDPDTGIMRHVHGPHIFHSDAAEVWRFVSRFAEFEPFDLRIDARVGHRLFPLPINLDTLRSFFGRDFTPAQAQAFIAECAIHPEHEPRNFEEQALSMIGRDLYQAFFSGYTQKQWGRKPADLPAAIFKRLPLRFNADRTYFHHSRVGIPRDGYTSMVENMLDHPAISLRMGTRFERSSPSGEYKHIFYTGSLDGYFGHAFGRLPYRSLRFEDFRVNGDFQKTAIVNYPGTEVPFTRITEHKKFAPWETFERSICSREYSFECGPQDTPFYPVNLAGGSPLLDRYRAEAARTVGVSFVGRLATFRYLDMDVAIGEAMAAVSVSLERLQSAAPIPAFFDGVPT
ncbi:FAD-dependent oxidoreductase [Mesorhizobium sp. KR9-304]|uniref:UDP-galactopyranose/dTDP-fucopyranose mutase family protein n=1 Tax=Mesorhizobium sp. KR9-304 TaxID=3156614 RepID=UPI0032B4BE5A